MSVFRQFARGFLVVVAVMLPFLGMSSAGAAEKALLTQDAEAALQALYKHEPNAKALGEKAVGILVFPSIVRAGFIVGGSGGDGVLFKKEKAVAYYNSGTASVGLQAGVQTFGYAVFFMTPGEMKKFENSKGWDIGAAPTVVVVDTGAGREFNTMTAKSGIYAFIFNQEGLMAGMALQGQKITRLK